MTKPAPIEGLDATSTLEEAARRSIELRLGDVRKYEEKLGAAAEPDDVHDMRVASRRLRAALTLFDRRRQLVAAHDAVEALGDALGQVRELHVQLAWLREELAAASERDKVGLQALYAEREAKLPRRIERLQAALTAWHQQGVPAVAAALAALDLPGRLGGHRVRRRLSRRLKDVKRRVAAACKSMDARTAHRLRIGAKKLRYLAELTQPAFPDGDRPPHRPPAAVAGDARRPARRRRAHPDRREVPGARRRPGAAGGARSFAQRDGAPRAAGGGARRRPGQAARGSHPGIAARRPLLSYR